MAKTKTLEKKARRPAKRTTRKAASRPAKITRKGARRPPARTADPLLGAVRGATQRMIGGVVMDVGRAGAARVKREIYPPGFHWAAHMKPIVGTDLCMHAHVGFLARGEIHIEYPDGCIVEHKAPQIVAIDPGHDGWVVGKEPAVLIELDFERDTASRLGMPTSHRHA
jgi:hypothetical protein